MIDFDKTPEIARWLGTGSINFFGLPYAGKDSQAHRLRNRFGGTMLSGGDILRNSAISKEARELIDNGRMAPTDEYVQTVTPYFSREEFAGKPLFLSAVGRWHGEEDSVITALEKSHHPLRAVVHLVLSEEQVMDRFHKSEKSSRGTREDDTAATLVKRFDEFNNKTKPVIEHYRELDYLIEVSANQSKDEVERQILGELAILASRD